MTKIQPAAASAVVPCAPFAKAIKIICEGLSDPVFGPLLTHEIQLCPQHAGSLNDGLIESFLENYPDVQFRLHASPRISGAHRHKIMTAANVMNLPDQARATARISQRLSAPAYTIHAGRTNEGTLEQALDNVRRLEGLFNCPVGIEGLYPGRTGEGPWLLSSWADHETLLASGVPYALDVSHLNIVAKVFGRRDDLVRELLNGPQCLEIHVSSNNGRQDDHKPLNPTKEEWWMSLLDESNSSATIFYEGVLVDPKPTIR